MSINISNGVTNFEQNLIAWGKSQKFLPENNSVLKANVLNRLKAGNEVAPVSIFPKFIFAGLALAALVLLVNLPKTQYHNTGISGFTAPALAPQNLNSDKLTNNENLKKSAEDLQEAPAASRSQLAPQGLSFKSQIAIGEPYGSTMPQKQTPPANDTREFVKTSYSAELKSRNVQKLAQSVQITIKGFNGRVDSFNNTENFAYINFVLPANKLDAFKEQIKTSVGERFYVETMLGENLLPQKQNIEEQQTQNQKQLAELQNQKNALTKNHNVVLAGLNSKLKTNQKTLQDTQNALNQNPGNIYLQNQVDELQKELKQIRQSIAGENSQFAYSSQNLDEQISVQNQYQESLNKQTADLQDNVNTVNGSIRIVKINFFEWLNFYVHLTWILLLIIAFAAYLTYKHSKPKAYPV